MGCTSPITDGNPGIFGKRLHLSQGRLRGEFTVTTCWFAPTTNSLEGINRLILLIIAFIFMN